MAYSYMTCEFPKEVQSHPNWPNFSNFRERLFNRSNVIEAATGGEHFFTAITTQEDSLKKFCKIALQIYAYCHITAGRSKQFMPKLCLFTGKGEWDPGVVWDGLEDLAFDLEKYMPYGWISFDGSLLNDVLSVEPAMKNAASKRIDHPWLRSGYAVAINCWDLLLTSTLQNSVLLNSALAQQLINIPKDDISKLINEIHDHPFSLAKLSPRHMEVLITELLSGLGYQVELTAQTRDGGRDAIVFALNKEHSPLPEQRYLVEIKHPNPGNAIGVNTLRSLVGVGETEPNTGLILVTSTRFTHDAKILATHDSLRYRLALRDYGHLTEWIELYCNSTLESSKSGDPK
jgi:hypothetical protein